MKKQLIPGDLYVINQSSKFFFRGTGKVVLIKLDEPVEDCISNLKKDFNVAQVKVAKLKDASKKVFMVYQEFQIEEKDEKKKKEFGVIFFNEDGFFYEESQDFLDYFDKLVL